MTAVIVKILTGVHAGAQITLTPGSWVFGRDDSCDIVLADSELALRHAALRVSEEGQVSAEDIEGVLRWSDERKIESALWQSGRIAHMANVWLTWGPEDAPQNFWDSVNEAVKKLTQITLPQQSEAEQERVEKTDAKKPDAVSESTAATVAPQGLTQGHKRALIGVGVFAFATVAVLASYCVNETWRNDAREYFAKQNPSPVSGVFNALYGKDGMLLGVCCGTPEKQSQILNAETLNQLLANSGFANVRAKFESDGTILFSGAVKNDVERGKLLQLARSRPQRVMLDVEVDSDYTAGIENSLKQMRYWPAVELKHLPQGKEMTVAVYMADARLEQKAFARADEFLPKDTEGKPTISLKRQVMYRTELERLVSDAFKKEKLPSLAVEYLPGSLRIHAKATDSVPKIEAALKRLYSTSSVPLKVELVDAAKTVAADEAAPSYASTDPMKPSFRVKAVSGDVLKFVTLSDGSKIFVGGVMPGGFILESISYNRLVLSKNKKRINYPLKVSK